MKTMERLDALNLKIPPVPKPAVAYVPATRVGSLIYKEGQVPVADGKIRFTGKVGKDVALEEDYEAAKILPLNCLGGIVGEIGDLDVAKRVVPLGVLANSTPGFHQQTQAANGASDSKQRY